MKKQLLVFATVLLGFSATAQIPTNGLVGDWPFDGNANDYSGNLKTEPFIVRLQPATGSEIQTGPIALMVSAVKLLLTTLPQ